MLERNEVLGGAIRTSGDLTAPGFTHELMASWHPLFAGSAAYAELGDDLRRHGLEYLNTDLPTATLFPDGGAAFLTTSLEDNVAEFERHAAGDGAAWSRQFEQFMASAEHSFGVLSAELWSTAGPQPRAQGLRQLRPPRAARVRGQLADQRARLARTRRSSPSARTGCSRRGCCTPASGPSRRSPAS